MKFRVYLVLVLFLSVSFFVFAIPCNALCPPDIKKALDEKLNEIRDKLELLMIKDYDADQFDAYLRHLLTDKSDRTLNSSPDNVNNIITHLKGIQSQTQSITIGYRSCVASTSSVHHDYEAIAVINFNSPSSKAAKQSDTLEFGLWHLKICIWW